MPTLTQAFTSVSAGAGMSVIRNDSITWAVTGTFVGTWVLEYSESGGTSWRQEATGTGVLTGTAVNTSRIADTRIYRFRASAYSSGTITGAMTDAAMTVLEHLDQTGVTRTEITDEGFIVTGNFSVSGTSTLTGAVTIGGTLSITGALTIATIVGGTGAGDDLTLRATSNATDGDIIFESDPTTERMRISSAGVVSIPGSLTITTDLAIAHGGTGQSTAVAAFDALSPVTTRGDMVIRDAANNVRLAVGAAARVLRSDGTDPAWGQVVLTTDVSGVLPIANGGTNGATQLAGFNNLSPVTTRGDIVIRDAANNVRLAVGAAARVLRSDGTDPSWSQITLTTDVTGTLPVANGGTGVTSSTGSTNVVLSGSPTIVTPTIASFANAAHNHQDAAGGAQLDHGAALTGLTDDDHTIYTLLLGRSGGQVVIGGTAAGDDLTLRATSSGTDGDIIFQTDPTTERLRITSAGMVSLTGVFRGFPVAGEDFAWNWDLVDSDFLVYSDTGGGTTSLIVIGEGVGSVGMGTNTPRTMLSTTFGTTNRVLQVAGTNPRFVVSGSIPNWYSVNTSGTADSRIFNIHHNANVIRLIGATDAILINWEFMTFGELDGRVTIGQLTNLPAKLGINGVADEIQILVQGFSTQTSSLLVLEQSDGTDVLTVSNDGDTIITQAVVTTGSPTAFTVTGGIHTTLTVGDYQDMVLNFARTVQWTTGAAITNADGILIQAPTYNATAATQTITTPATVRITGAPVDGGVNMVFTNGPYSLLVDAGEVRFAGTLTLGTDLAIADGGTGQSTAVAAFDALSPVTTQGDIVIRDASNNVRLAVGAANRVLRSDGTDPSWAQVVLTSDVSGTLPVANGGTGVTSSTGSGTAFVLSTTPTFTTSIITPIVTDSSIRLGQSGGSVGFYATSPITLQTGVAVTAAGVHAACVALGLFTA